jgi:hypothetical protein
MDLDANSLEDLRMSLNPENQNIGVLLEKVTKERDLLKYKIEVIQREHLN